MRCMSAAAGKQCPNSAIAFAHVRLVGRFGRHGRRRPRRLNMGDDPLHVGHGLAKAVLELGDLAVGLGEVQRTVDLGVHLDGALSLLLIDANGVGHDAIPRGENLNRLRSSPRRPWQPVPDARRHRRWAARWRIDSSMRSRNAVSLFETGRAADAYGQVDEELRPAAAQTGLGHAFDARRAGRRSHDASRNSSDTASRGRRPTACPAAG